MRLRARLLSSTMWSGFVGGLLLAAGPASAADIVVKAPQYEMFAPAVDGPNGKIEGFGGSFADKTIYGAKGAFSVPLGNQFGLQIDGAAGSFDDRGFGSIGGHLFWRNPAQGLIGIYANHTHWDRFGGVHVTQVAGEGELYVGRWSLQGIAGVEFGNRASQVTTTSTTDVTLVTTTTTLTESYDVKTQFFDKISRITRWTTGRSSSATATSEASTPPRSAASSRCRLAAANWPRCSSKVVPGKMTSAACGAP
jgi:hypothetical protein